MTPPKSNNAALISLTDRTLRGHVTYGGTLMADEETPSPSDETAPVQETETETATATEPDATPPAGDAKKSIWTPGRTAALAIGVVAVIVIIAVLVDNHGNKKTPAVSSSDSGASLQSDASVSPVGSDPGNSSPTDSTTTSTTAPTNKTVTHAGTGVSFALPSNYLVVDLTAPNFQDQLDQIANDNPQLASGAAQATALVDQGGQLWSTDTGAATGTQNVAYMTISPSPIDITDQGTRDQLQQNADSEGAVDVESHDVTTPAGPGLAVTYKITTADFDLVNDAYWRVLYVPHGDQVFVVTVINGSQADADQIFQRVTSTFKVG
jgi:hypothetical protein